VKRNKDGKVYARRYADVVFDERSKAQPGTMSLGEAVDLTAKAAAPAASRAGGAVINSAVGDSVKEGGTGSTVGGRTGDEGGTNGESPTDIST
jgi:hypothetical protein